VLWHEPGQAVEVLGCFAKVFLLLLRCLLRFCKGSGSARLAAAIAAAVAMGLTAGAQRMDLKDAFAQRYVHAPTSVCVAKLRSPGCQVAETDRHLALVLHAHKGPQ
jgi:hypothetical protein